MLRRNNMSFLNQSISCPPVSITRSRSLSFSQSEHSGGSIRSIQSLRKKDLSATNLLTLPALRTTAVSGGHALGEGKGKGPPSVSDQLKHSRSFGTTGTNYSHSLTRIEAIANLKGEFSCKVGFYFSLISSCRGRGRSI